jgi:hypothetical protein
MALVVILVAIAGFAFGVWVQDRYDLVGWIQEKFDD